jgi:serine/threonine protein kinase
VIQAGEILDGYRAIRRIGAGGFGEVWLCRNEAFGDLRALKFIPSSDRQRLDREHAALCKYREESGRLLNKALMPIEHANLRADGLFYIMPLADGTGSIDPVDELWRPVTLAARIKERAAAPRWFSSGEVKAFITPMLKALQMMDDARLIHRDVKPENILFRNGSPCLSDISLLNGDLTDRSRSGTYGYGAPEWYLEAGGHPDMYGVAATLFVLLTGKSPDKMAQSRHRWPPQGELSLLEEERREWQDIHRLIDRATDDDSTRRFLSFGEFERILNQNSLEQVPESALKEIRRLEQELEATRWEMRKQRDEFEMLSKSTMTALEEASLDQFALPDDADKSLAALAERFETGLTAARAGVHWIKARDLTERAVQILKTANEKYSPAIGLGLEELRSGIERILKTDRDFHVDQVRDVLAKALSISMPELGSLAGRNASAKLAGLQGAGKIGAFLNVAGLMAPAVLTNAKTLQGAARAIVKIIESATGFLEDQGCEFSERPEISSKN